MGGPGCDEDQEERQPKANQGRQDNGQQRRPEPAPHHSPEARLGNACTNEPADQSMRATGGNATGPGDHIPQDGSHESPEDHGSINDSGRDDTAAQRSRHMQPEEQECDEVEKGSPGHGDF